MFIKYKRPTGQDATHRGGVKDHFASAIIKRANSNAIRIHADNGNDVASTNSAKRAEIYRIRKNAGQRMSLKILNIQTR